MYTTVTLERQVIAACSVPFALGAVFKVLYRLMSSHKLECVVAGAVVAGVGIADEGLWQYCSK